MIGNNVRYFNIGYKERITNFEKFNFIFIDRFVHEHIDSKFKTLDNVIVYNQISTIDMIDLLKKSNYVFLTDIEHKKIERISASISLALNCLCTMIIPKDMNKYYNFQSVIEYENQINIREPNFNLVLSDLEYHLEHKIKVFDKYIK